MTNSFGKSAAKVTARRGATLAVLLVGAASLMTESEASAQGWLADRRYTEGPGIRTGDLELHPGIGGEVGYDSNWFQRSNAEGPNVANGAPALPPTDAAVFRITPSFYLSTLGVQRTAEGGGPGPRFVTFQAGASATARFFLGKEMSDQHNVSLNADARLDLNRGQPIGVGFFGAYNRLIQPQVSADPNIAFNRDDVRVGAEVIGMPGGGTFDIRAGYALNASLYEQTNGAPFSSITHELTVRDRWKFRPRTALFTEASLSFLNYPNAQRATFYLNDSIPLRTRGGVTGLVTNWFGLTAAVGYGATFFKDPKSEQYDSINAQVEGTFYLGGGPNGGGSSQDLPGEATLLLSSLTVGFARDFQRSLLGNYYGVNRAYAKLVYWFAGRVIADLHLAGEQLNYPTILYTNAAIPTTPEFTNYRLLGGIFAEYRFSSQFGLNTTIDYIRQFSDQQLPASAPVGTTIPGVYDQNYGRLQAFLGFRYFW